MKNTLKIAAMISVLGATLPAFAQSAPQSLSVETRAAGQASQAQKVQLQGRVVALDKATRSLVIKGGGGNEVALIAGEEVKNFDQIAVGDLVTVAYGYALALELRKTDSKQPTIRKRVESADAAAAAPGSKPGVAAAHRVEFVADVTKVNKKRQTITLRGVEHTVELHVQDPAQFKAIKVGDQVAGVYSEAMAISVTAKPKK